MACLHVAPGIYVCTGQNSKVTATEEYADKWCFKCRKRLRHRLYIHTADYYDPEGSWDCPRCKTDSTRFPGF